MLKSESLHFEINPSRYKLIGYIRNSYREDGKVKHQTISKIHGLSHEQLQNMKAAFDGAAIKHNDIKLSDGREYGASALLYNLAKKIGLNTLMYSKNEPWVRNALAMIIGRIVYQGSKLALSKIVSISCLWEVCGVKNITIDVDKNCYDAMDELLARQMLIQKRLALKHLSNGSVILYDITSTYFEGEFEDSNIIEFGYNRDKKRRKKQIVIALICTKEGCPVAVEVFSGNTSDSTTVQAKIEEIKKNYGVSNFIFVGDRGMLTQKNIDECKNIETITALKHAAIKKLCEEENVQLSMFDEELTTEVILPEEPEIRYALKKNPVRAERQRKFRSELIQKTEGALTEIATPKKKVADKTLAVRVAKVFCKYKTEKYFTWDIQESKVVYSRKENIITDEEKYDGLYVIRSNVSGDIMTICEIVETYKSLVNVEQAFRNIKTVQLEIRPVYHRTDERIKSHVFICMLSYYLLWHMNRALKPLYEDPEHPEFTQNHVIETMKALQKLKLSIGSIATDTIAEPTEMQRRIQKLVSGCVV